MIVTCPACSARFHVSESTIEGRGVVASCPRCGGRFVAVPGDPAMADATPSQIRRFTPGQASSATPPGTGSDPTGGFGPGMQVHAIAAGPPGLGAPQTTCSPAISALSG